jgi:hypothetical protein
MLVENSVQWGKCLAAKADAVSHCFAMANIPKIRAYVEKNLD